MFRFLPLFTLVIMFQLPAFCQSVSLSKWQVTDLAFQASSSQPFDVSFGAVFTGPDNQKMNVPGFYNGNNDWVIRFSSSVPGKWQYTTYSSMPKLSGKTGKVVVADKAPQGEHGAIVIDPKHPQQFMYEDGTPYFLMAFELDWLFAMDYGKPELTTANQLLQTIKKNGFNQVVMNVYAYDVVWEKDKKLEAQYEYGHPDFYPFGGSNKQPDFSRLNADYFKHLDKVIKLLQEEGIVAHLMIYVWNKSVNWPDMYSAADNMYYDYVVKRYQAYPNIVWDVSKEALYYGRADKNYITERIDRLRSADAYKRLVSVHDFAYCSSHPEKVDFISIQYWGVELYDKMRGIKEQFKTKPIFNIEHGGYEEGPYEVFTGNFISAEACLKRNYACAFAGVYSTYYWQNTSWNVIIPNPFQSSVQPQPKFRYFDYMTSFFNKYPFREFQPSHAPAGNWSMSNGNGTYLVYVPADNYAIYMNTKEKLTPQTQFTWFNPLTGVYTKADASVFKTFPKVIAPANEQDNILVVSFSK